MWLYGDIMVIVARAITRHWFGEKVREHTFADFRYYLKKLNAKMMYRIETKE